MARRNSRVRLSYHDDIARWFGEGRSLNEISAMVRRDHGDDMDRNAVNRYLFAHGLKGPASASADAGSVREGEVGSAEGIGESEAPGSSDAPGNAPATPAAEDLQADPIPPDRDTRVPAASEAEASATLEPTSEPLSATAPDQATEPAGDEGSSGQETNERSAEAPPDLPVLTPQVAMQINRLKALWVEGVLTGAEFRAAVERLIGLPPVPTPPQNKRPPIQPSEEAPAVEPVLAEDEHAAEEPELFASPQPAPHPIPQEATPPSKLPAAYAPQLPRGSEVTVPARPAPAPKPSAHEPVPALAWPPMLSQAAVAEAAARREPWRPPPPPFAPLVRLPAWVPDLPILSFPQGDEWSLRDACEGTFILGATGSGKTSGSGKAIACAFLSLGFGGLVLCVKPDERQLWEEYAAATGRSGQMCVVRSGGPFRFNFLDYEAQRCRPSLDWVENVTHLFSELMAVFARGRGDRSPGSFWVHAGNQLLRNTLRILARSRHGLQLAEIGALVAEAPMSLAEVKLGSWRETPHFGAFMQEAQRQDTVSSDMQQAQRYWLQEFPALPDKTRAILVTGLSAMVDVLYTSDIYDLFCRDTTLTPEAVQDGAIIVVDLPLKTRDFTGLLTQCIWKYFFQKAIERRSEPADACRRPAFLWIDEAQFFYTEYDSLFQSTGRSSGCATVYLTQNIANFYGMYGGDRNRIDGFLGNLNTKIFHANNDPASNAWAAEQIGKSMQYRASINSRDPQPPRSWQEALFSFGRSGGGGVNVNPQMDYAVQPGDFAKLRTGGVQNDLLVEAYFTKSGARFANGKHYFRTAFSQETVYV